MKGKNKNFQALKKRGQPANGRTGENQTASGGFGGGSEKDILFGTKGNSSEVGSKRQLGAAGERGKKT